MAGRSMLLVARLLAAYMAANLRTAVARMSGLTTKFSRAAVKRDGWTRRWAR